MLEDSVPASEQFPRGKPNPERSRSRTYTYEPAGPTLLKFHDSKALFRGIMGPFGSGKSVTCCNEMFAMAGHQAPFTDGVRRTRWGVVRATYAELLTTTLKTWKSWFRDMAVVRESVPITSMVRCQHPSGDGTIIEMETIFAAFEREEDTRKLLSMELTGIWYNEARELPWGIIRDGMGRIGRYPSKQDGGHTRKSALADTNPPDSDHWWYRLAEDGRLNDDAVGVTTADFEFFKQPGALLKIGDKLVPNPSAENVGNMTDGYRYWLDQVAGRDARWINVYLLGNYGSIQDGKPVYGSSYNDQLHTSPVAFDPVAKWPIVLAFDFGMTPACVFLQPTPMGQVRIIEEIVTEDCGIRRLCKELVKPRLAARYRGCPVVITGDPAGEQRSQNDEQTAYQVIREELAGLFIDCVPAVSNLMSVRVDAVIQALERLTGGKAFLQVSPECKMIRKGFNGEYKYAKIRVPGGAERYQEMPVKNIYSHISEAVQYGLMHVVGAVGQRGRDLGDTLMMRGTKSTPYSPADRITGY